MGSFGKFLLFRVVYSVFADAILLKVICLIINLVQVQLSKSIGSKIILNCDILIISLSATN